MIRPDSRLGRCVSALTAFAIVNLSFPTFAFAQAPTLRQARETLRLPNTEELSIDAMRSIRGSSGENPYLAGSNKWSVDRHGVDLTTGNYSTSITDLAFEGNLGIPINVTRNYSANNPDESPIGKGWTLSVDVQTTASGLIKSPGTRSLSIPASYKERPVGQEDPKMPDANEPVDAVIAVDASGFEETIQRDVDGVLTQPPSNKNKTESDHELVYVGDMPQWVLTRNVVVTPEDTTYVYEKLGDYVGGSRPYNNSGATPTPSNVLKPRTITDRHGNITTYTYDESTYVTFQKSNGVVRERPLIRIESSSGRVLEFTWGDGTSGRPLNRIVSISDGTRTLEYRYNEVDTVLGRTLVPSGYNGPGLLTSVTSPGGYRSTIGYGDPGVFPHSYGTWTWERSYNIVDRLTDHRGLTTQIRSMMGKIIPFWGTYTPAEYNMNGVFTYAVERPDGMKTVYGSYANAESDEFKGVEQWMFNGPDRDVDYYHGGWWRWIPGGAYGMHIQYWDVAVAGGPRRVVDGGTLHTKELGIGDLLIVRTSFVDQSGWQDYNYDYSPDEWYKYYHGHSQDLLQETTFTGTVPQPVEPTAAGTVIIPTGNDYDSYYQVTRKVTTYNFLGEPLKEIFTERAANIEGQFINTGIAVAFVAGVPLPVDLEDHNRDWTVLYAYHNADKYYALKASRDHAGRFVYYDYYDRSAPQGKKGQAYRTYEHKYSNWSSANLNDPAVWRRDIAPANPSSYTMEADYDSFGRKTNLLQLKATSPSYQYKATRMVYHANSAPNYGLIAEEWEDYTGTNRLTRFSQYHVTGKPIFFEQGIVGDGTYRILRTEYDTDGRLLWVRRVNNGLNQLVTSTTYGTSGVANGMAVQQVDGVNNVVQNITYLDSGPGAGKINSTEDIDGSHVYRVDYTYNSFGDRDTSRYTTPTGVMLWKYDGYLSITNANGSGRQFQVMTRLNPTSGARTSEEIHYVYDTVGRVRTTFYAQTPQESRPLHPERFYSYEYGAKSRARTDYDYDGGGRIRLIKHSWDVLTYPAGEEYNNIPIRAFEYDYSNETGQRTKMVKHKGVWNGSAWVWQADQTDTYSYDPATYEVTGAVYGDGLSNHKPIWKYDPMGNRISDSTRPGDWQYDGLNRLIKSPGATYANDFLGNRTKKNVGTASWIMKYDVVNRMTSISGATGNTSYRYRADGLRVSKSGNMLLTEMATPAEAPKAPEPSDELSEARSEKAEISGLDLDTATTKDDGSSVIGPPVMDLPMFAESLRFSPASNSTEQLSQVTSRKWTTRYYYDETSTFEETTTVSGAAPVINRYALGARKVDAIIQQTGVGAPEQTFYPLYDGHGNMAALLQKAGVDNFAISNERTYDVWGNIRKGNQTGGPSGRFVANLHHKSDDESSLVYMWARYYDPETGRFLSEDANKNHRNHFFYVQNDPINLIDPDGRVSKAQLLAAAQLFQLGVEFLTESISALMSGMSGRQYALRASAWALGVGIVTAGYSMISMGYKDVMYGTALMTGAGRVPYVGKIAEAVGAKYVQSGVKAMVLGFSMVALGQVIASLAL